MRSCDSAQLRDFRRGILSIGRHSQGQWSSLSPSVRFSCIAFAYLRSHFRQSRFSFFPAVLSSYHFFIRSRYFYGMVFVVKRRANRSVRRFKSGGRAAGLLPPLKVKLNITKTAGPSAMESSTETGRGYPAFDVHARHCVPKAVREDDARHREARVSTSAVALRSVRPAPAAPDSVKPAPHILTIHAPLSTACGEPPTLWDGALV